MPRRVGVVAVTLSGPSGALKPENRRNAARKADICDHAFEQSELSGWVFVFLAEQRNAAEGDSYGEAQGDERP
jgi:hypothetical protein